MRRDEGGVGQKRLPGAADIDQVVAVGAIAVQEHDEAFGLCRIFGSRLGPTARDVWSGHCVLLSLLSCAAGFAAFGLIGLASTGDAFAPLHDMIIAPEQMRRHAAPWPPCVGDRDHLLGGRPRCFRPSAMRADSCSARSPAGQASAWPRQNRR